MLQQDTPIQIIVSGKFDSTATSQPNATSQMIATVHSMLLPQKVLILADGNEESILYKNLKILKNISHTGTVIIQNADY